MLVPTSNVFQRKVFHIDPIPLESVLTIMAILRVRQQTKSLQACTGQFLDSLLGTKRYILIRCLYNKTAVIPLAGSWDIDKPLLACLINYCLISI